MTTIQQLNPALAARLARLALGHIGREYPHKLDHVLGSDADALPPSALHPIFFGSFDWHSCVHGWWTLLTLRRLFPALPEATAIAAAADASFTAGKVAAELAYVERPLADSFERPYGWTWLLRLHGEMARHPERWAEQLEPIARAVGRRLAEYLHKLTYPIRSGTHANSAFALATALPWAQAFDAELEQAIRARAARWYTDDRDCQAWEPSGEDFLSPALIEALAFARALPVAFPEWFAGFLPQAAQRQPATLFTPAFVGDHHDGKIVHLDGLNLSRAWCWRALAPLLPAGVAALAHQSAKAHLATALPHLSDDYAGEHWLASFALLALLDQEIR